MSKLFITQNSYGREILVGDDVKLKYRNFSGINNKNYPDPNKKTFDIYVDDPDMVALLTEKGCNVRIKQDADGNTYHLLTIKMNYGPMIKFPPRVTLWSNGVKTTLDENDVATILDTANIIKLGFEASIAPQKADPSRSSVWLNRMDVVIEPDRFATYGSKEEQ